MVSPFFQYTPVHVNCLLHNESIVAIVVAPACVPLLTGPYLPHLQHLDLRAAGLTPQDVVALLASPDRAALIGLKLSSNPQARSLVAALAGHEGLGRLRSLGVEANNLGDEGAALLAG